MPAASQQALAVSASAKPRVLIIGPVPPPYHGLSMYTRMLITAPLLREHFDIVHLDTTDSRSLANMGKLDFQNITLAIRHVVRLVVLMWRARPEVAYVAVSQNAWAYLRDSVLMAVIRAHGCRIVTHLHGSDFRRFYDRSNLLVKGMIRLTSAWVSQAAVLAENLRTIYDGLIPAAKLRVAAPGVPDAFGSDGLRDRIGDGQPLRICYVGMLYRPKGILDLVRACEMLQKQGIRLSATIAGPWYSEEDRTETEALVRSAGLEGVVAFPGAVDGAAKNGLLKDSDVFVFPGTQPEGVPLSIIEAFSSGLPVVATAVGAIPAMMDHDVEGMVIPPGQPSVLAAALIRMQDPALRQRMSRRARARYENAYTDRHSMQAVVDLFKSATRVA